MSEGVCKKCGQILELDGNDLCANCASGEADFFWDKVKALEEGKGLKLGGDLRQIRREIEAIKNETSYNLVVKETADGKILVVRKPKRIRQDRL